MNVPAETTELQARVPVADERVGPAAPRGPAREWRLVWFGWVSVFVVVTASWEFVARARLMNPVFIGEPSQIIVSFAHGIGGTLLRVDAVYTVVATVVGFGAASAAGIAVAFALSQSRVLRRIADPYFTAVNSLPRVALAPLFLMWFGIGLGSKVMLAASLTFFVVFANTMAGIESVDPDHLLLARLIGASRSQTFWKFVVPSAIPSIFAGLELGFIYGMLGTVAGEMIAGQHGLGVRLTYDAQVFETNDYFATLLLLVVITIGLSQFLHRARSRLLRWQSAHIGRSLR